MPGVGQRAAQIDVDAGGREAGFQRRLQHVPRNARVLADEDAGTIAAPRAVDRDQRAARGPAEFHHEFGRDRGFADAAANAVGAEVFAVHGVDYAPAGTTLP